MKSRSYLLIVTILAVAIASCRNVKEVTYFQPSDTASSSNTKVKYANFPDKDPKKMLPNFEAKLQTGDILSIYVTSLSPEASSFFNTITPGTGPIMDNYSTKPDIGYRIDPNGDIELPLVGKIKLAGLTTSIAHDTLVSRLEKYLQVPTVRLYIVNFKVTLLGEVNKPGVYSVTNEKINFPEAVALAGDLTIFANRKEIMLIREIDGEKTYTKIDITKRDLFNSSYYYLRSNDILYIPPVKGKVAQTDNFYRIFPIVISTITLAALIALRFIDN